MSIFYKGRNTLAKAEGHTIGLYLHTIDSVGEEDVTSGTKTIAHTGKGATVSSVVDGSTKPLPKTLTDALAALQLFSNKYADWRKRVIALAREAVQSVTSETVYSATCTAEANTTTTVDGCARSTTPQRRITRRPRAPYAADVPAFSGHVQPNLVDGLIGYVAEG